MLLRIKLFLIKTLYVFEPVARIVFNLIYLTKLSKWRKNNPLPPEFTNYIKNRKNITRFDLYEYLLVNEDLKDEKIDYLEFGVYKGKSLQWWSENVENPDARFFGFDTFTGLPEVYRNLEEGYFSTDGCVPEIDDNRISYEIGLFSETLLPFLEKVDLNGKTVVNFDADLYSSSLFVLNSLVPRLKKGSIIIFDEFSGHYGEHEFRAFTDFTCTYWVKCKLLGAVNNYMHVAFKLI